jgi:glutathione S-transferase
MILAGWAAASRELSANFYGKAALREAVTAKSVSQLGLNYDHKDYLPRAPETRTPEFRALNPNGRVPVIDDDGFVLSESMAINLYLSKKYESPLYPSDPRNEALAWQWSLWETDRLDRQIVNYVRHTTEFPEAERKKEIAEAAWQQVTESFDVLEAALAKAEWLAGPVFSVGDLNVAAALYRALAIDTKKWPRTQAWLHRCWERPAAKRARAMREGK